MNTVQQPIQQPRQPGYFGAFAAGFEPTGYFTFRQSQDASDAARRPWLRAAGVAGGTLGGAMLLPALVGGAMGLGKRRALGGTLRAFAQGAARPYRELYHAQRYLRGVDAVQRGAAGLSPQALESGRRLTQSMAPELSGPLSTLLGGSTDAWRHGVQAAQTAQRTAQGAAQRVHGAAQSVAGQAAPYIERGRRVAPGAEQQVRAAAQSAMDQAVPYIERGRGIADQLRPTADYLRARAEMTKVDPLIDFFSNRVRSMRNLQIAGIGAGAALGGGSAYLQAGQGFGVGDQLRAAQGQAATR